MGKWKKRINKSQVSFPFEKVRSHLFFDFNNSDKYNSKYMFHESEKSVKGLEELYLYLI